MYSQGKKPVIYNDILQEITNKHVVKFPSYRNVSVAKKRIFINLVSTLEFVLGRDVQLPLESELSLFNYTPSHPSNLRTRLHGFA